MNYKVAQSLVSKGEAFIGKKLSVKSKDENNNPLEEEYEFKEIGRILSLGKSYSVYGKLVSKDGKEASFSLKKIIAALED